jgi:hypothetical protein
MIKLFCDRCGSETNMLYNFDFGESDDTLVVVSLPDHKELKEAIIDVGLCFDCVDDVSFYLLKGGKSGKNSS